MSKVSNIEQTDSIDTLTVDAQTAEQELSAQPPEHPVDKQEMLMQMMIERLEKSGDLPIFSASVNHIQIVGNDPDSDAMELAIEVLKDANLTAKVLRLANSSYYNRGNIRVGALSRAIVLLGFDAVKSTVLAMKLIDSFQHEQPGIDMSGMLVNAYMTAGLAKELASASGLKTVEQSFVCGLLYNLGEVILAYTMPELYLEMQQLVDKQNISWAEAQKRVIEMPLRKIGQHMVEKWEFPDIVSQTMQPHVSSARKGPLRDQVELTRALTSLSARIMDLLYSEKPASQQTFSEIAGELSKVTGINKDVVATCLDKSFKQSCDLAEEYGLDKELLSPKLRDDMDESLGEMARKLKQYASRAVIESEDDEVDSVDADDGYAEAAQEVMSTEEVQEEVFIATPGGDANIMLSILSELTTMMTNKAHLNSLFNKVLEGMHRGVGFDRSMLCLLSADRQYYSARMVLGYRAEKVKNYFHQFPVQITRDVFSKMIMEDDVLLVPDVRTGNWLQRLPRKFDEVVETDAFLIAALRVRGKPVGMFYADKSHQHTPISKDEQRGFLQLVAQAQLALQVR